MGNTQKLTARGSKFMT